MDPCLKGFGKLQELRLGHAWGDEAMLEDPTSVCCLVHRRRTSARRECGAPPPHPEGEELCSHLPQHRTLTLQVGVQGVGLWHPG